MNIKTVDLAAYIQIASGEEPNIHPSGQFEFVGNGTQKSTSEWKSEYANSLYRKHNGAVRDLIEKRSLCLSK